MNGARAIEVDPPDFDAPPAPNASTPSKTEADFNGTTSVDIHTTYRTITLGASSSDRWVLRRIDPNVSDAGHFWEAIP